jgi:protein involved in ribonucleotide reduction
LDKKLYHPTFGESFYRIINFFIQMKYMYTPYSCLIFLFLTAIACKNAPNTEGSQTLNAPVETAISTAKTSKTLTFQIIDAPNKTFGYDISVDGKKLIHQTSIPAVAGIEGFKTAAQAEKVAQYLIGKMKKNDALPAVSPDELKQLGVL